MESKIVIKTGEPFDLAEVEEKMLSYDQVDCPVIHRFGPGIYIREVKIPAGTLAVGHRQTHEHLNIFLQGRVTMLNEDGSTAELSAPMIFNGNPGRKIGYVHEDMVWLNVYATDERDVETLESVYLDKSEGWLKEKKISKQLQLFKRVADVEDFKRLLLEFGFTEGLVRQQSENESDLIDMPRGHYKFLVSDSNINGKGVFATAEIEPGEAVGPARIGGKRTPLGRYVNHSVCPNAEMVKSRPGDIYLVALETISGCRGGQNGDEITTNYRNTLKLIGVSKCQE